MDAQAQPPGGLESGPHYGVEPRVPHFVPPVGSQTLVNHLSFNYHLSGPLVSTPAVPRLRRGLQQESRHVTTAPIALTTARSTCSPAPALPGVVSSPSRRQNVSPWRHWGDIGESLAAGLIRPSSSPTGAGFFFMGKKDGTLRPCIDYRGLNAITAKNRYPIPLISSAFAALQRAQFFTKLDLRNAYHLVRIREGEKWKTAFNTPRGHYEYLVTPFGLTNAPAVFQALVNDVLRDVINRNVFVYLDDILVFSETLEEHVAYVRLVLQRLLENRLFAKAERCEFHRSTVQFLCFVVSRGKLEMDPAKTKAVVSWPTPTDRKELQRFLGFANFYRRFIRGFSSTVQPLTALTSTKLPFLWTAEAEAAFTTLKTRFSTAPILIVPNPELQFILEVDVNVTMNWLW